MFAHMRNLLFESLHGKMKQEGASYNSVICFKISSFKWSVLDMLVFFKHTLLSQKLFASLSFILFVFFSPDTSFAQVPLSWPDCIEVTSEQNPDIMAARASLDSSEFKKNIAESGYYPQITGGAGVTRSNQGQGGGSFSFSSDSNLNNNSSGASTTTSVSIAAEQNIFSGFETQSNVAVAKANISASSASFDIVKAQVSYDLKSAFSNVIYSQKYLDLTTEIIKRRQDNLNLVELRYQGGWENKGSYLLSKAAVSQAEYDNLQAKHAILLSKQQLAKVLGREDTDGLDISGEVPTSEPEKNVDFIKILPGIPEDRQALAQLQAATSQLDVAKAPFYPNISASAQGSRQDRSSSSTKEQWEVGLNMSVPLFTGGKNYYGVKSAASDMATAASNRESVDRKLMVTLRQTLNAFVDAIAKVKVDEEYVVAASTRAEIGRSKYNNGLLSFEDWDTIENDLISREKSLLLSRRDRVIAEAQWEQVQGKGVIQ